MTDGLNMVIDGYAQLWGITGPAMLLLMSVVISLAVGIFFAQRFKNKDIGTVASFFTFGICAFLGWVNWITFIIPLIIVAVIEYYSMQRGGR